LQALEFFDDAEATWGGEFACDFVFATLVVCGRAKTTRLCGFEFEAGQKAIKRQIEIEPCLLAIRDDIEAGGNLIVNRCDDSIVLQFAAIIASELIEMLDGEFEPAGKRIAANDGGSERLFLHENSRVLSSLPLLRQNKIGTPDKDTGTEKGIVT
jgi:hypothetical protein